jgi:hypothetical protein
MISHQFILSQNSILSRNIPGKSEKKRKKRPVKRIIQGEIGEFLVLINPAIEKPSAVPPVNLRQRNGPSGKKI